VDPLGSGRCHACGADRLLAFYELSDIPVQSCALLRSREAALAFPTGDLKLVVCESCGFISNSRFRSDIQGELEDYETSQAFSDRFSAYLHELCQRLIDSQALREKDIVEIGCGGGDFLRLICQLGENRGVGFDPAFRGDGSSAETERNVTFIREPYDETTIETPADLIACRHTLEHIPDVRSFVEMIQAAVRAHPEALVFFEVPDVERVLAERAFWDVYYEHCSYFSFGSLARLFRACGFRILDLDRVYDGQYLILTAGLDNQTDERRLPGEDDVELLLREASEFERAMARELATWRERLERFASRRERVALWGSGSKAAGLLATLGVRDEISYIVDINPRKHGMFQAGTGQEIVPPEFLRSYNPDVIVIMNPVYESEIRRDLAQMELAPEILVL
jgi:SAM-dependent methyltransferase